MGSTDRRFALLVAAAAFSFLAAPPAEAASASATPRAPGGAEAAKTYPESGEVLMQADELTYDRERKVVTATGHVEIAYGGRILLADKVTYDETTGVSTADGHVALLDPDGNVAFADHVVLRNELKDGVAQTLSVLMTDKSRLAGRDAERKGGEITTLHRGVYSPCEICTKKGQTTPLWQIKAFRVVHNKTEQRIVFEDAFMELFGVPVFYLPFFSQPDPTVKRKSGFLAPDFASSTELGQQITIPYFWAIAPNMDVTLAPRFTTKEGIVYQGEFRHRIAEGSYRFFGTANWPETRKPGTQGDEPFRGSLFGNGEFSLAPDWSWGFQSEFVTDNTYLRKYGLSNATDLTSNIHLNQVNGRNSFSANAYYFQNLLLASNSDTPWVAPTVDFNHYFGDLLGAGRLNFSSNAMLLGTPGGLGSRRVSGSFDWDMPFTARGGEVYRLFASLRGDAYWTDKVPNPAAPGINFGNETIVRGLPTFGAEASYPLVRAGRSLREVIEPIAQVIYSPSIGNTERIPNMDSLNVEFDDTSLFSENRFPGLDRWETGARTNVGVRYSIFGSGGGQASVLFGQSFRMNEDTSFTTASGLRDQRSDYVGAIRVAPNDNLFAVHRFRINKNDFKFSRNEFDILARTGPLTTQLGYAYFAADQALTTAAGAREEVSLGAVLKLSEYWRLFGGSVRDLANSQTISNEIGLGYQDDCFGLAIGFYQSNISYQDIQRSNTFLIQITFKNLGTTGVGSEAGLGSRPGQMGIVNPGPTVFGDPSTSVLGNPAKEVFGYRRRGNGLY